MIKKIKNVLIYYGSKKYTCEEDLLNFWSKKFYFTALLIVCFSLALVSFFIEGNWGTITLSSQTPNINQCRPKKLNFSADYMPTVQKGPDYIWGGNASEGYDQLFSPSFLSSAAKAKAEGQEVFAYLGGPCGFTNGQNVGGEIERCARIHKNFNSDKSNQGLIEELKTTFSKPRGFANTPEERWIPYTFAQLKLSEKHNIDYCEVDNLNNNYNIDMISFFKIYKKMYDEKKIHCKLTLKNLNTSDLNKMISQIGTGKKSDFVAPFHIFEDKNEAQKPVLTAKIQELKGSGARTIVSKDSTRYGAAFSQDSLITCSTKTIEAPKLVSIAKPQPKIEKKTEALPLLLQSFEAEEIELIDLSGN